jgi:hypothetical protein
VAHYTRRASDRPAAFVRRGFVFGCAVGLAFLVGRMEGRAEVGAFCASWRPLHLPHSDTRGTLQRPPLGLPFALR